LGKVAISISQGKKNDILNVAFSNRHIAFINPALPVNLHCCTYRIIVITD